MQFFHPILSFVAFMTVHLALSPMLYADTSDRSVSARPAASESHTLAFSLEPMLAEIVLPKISQTFTLRNLTENSRKIRIEVLERRQEGEREFGRKTSELRTLGGIAGGVVELPAESAKSFEIEYRGPKRLSTERAYRLVVTDETPSDGTVRSLKLSYRASVYVREATHTPDLVIRSWRPTGGAGFDVVLRNQGRIRQPLAGMGFQGLDLAKSSIKVLEAGVMLAGSERRLSLEVADHRQLQTLGATSPLILRLPASD
jgi:hypothetical protein